MNSAAIVSEFTFYSSQQQIDFRNRICVTYISYLVSVQKVYLHAYSGSFNEKAGAVLELSAIQCLSRSNDSSISNLFQYFDSIVMSAGSPFSQIYVVGNVSKYFTTLS